MPNITEGEIKGDTSEVRSLVHNLWTEVAQLRDELRGTKQMKPVSSFVDPTTRRVSMHDVQSKTTKEEIYSGDVILGGRTVSLRLQSVYVDATKQEYKLGINGTEHLLIIVQEPTCIEPWPVRALLSLIHI
mgnify:FL=1